MAAATSVFMTLLLPLLGIPFSPFSWQLLLAVSLTGFSMIQPLILIALFLIGCIRGENRRGIAGAVISILGIVGFQFLK